MPHDSDIFKVCQEGEILIVEPPEDTLGYEESDLDRAIEDLFDQLEEPEVVHLIIDLGRAPSHSSIMIGAIMGLCQKVKNDGGKAVLCHASPSMMEALKTMRLDTVHPYMETVEKAMHLIQSPR